MSSPLLDALGHVSLRRKVLIVALLNFGYFGIALAVARCGDHDRRSCHKLQSFDVA